MWLPIYVKLDVKFVIKSHLNEDLVQHEGLRSGQHIEHLGMVQQPMNPLLPQNPLPIPGVIFSSGVGVSELRMGSNHNLVSPVGGLVQAQAHVLGSNLVSGVGPSHMSQVMIFNLFIPRSQCISIFYRLGAYYC